MAAKANGIEKFQRAPRILRIAARLGVEYYDEIPPDVGAFSAVSWPDGTPDDDDADRAIVEAILEKKPKVAGVALERQYDITNNSYVHRCLFWGA